MCFAPQRRALFRHLNCQKWSGPGVFCTFWLQNVLRATTVCPFRHLNCQKWSGPGVFCTFWLQNVLRATTITTACTFSRSQLPKVLRAPGVLYILTWKCASRHNGAQFFISPLASWLRTRHFSEPTFRPPRAPNHRNNTAFATFLPFRASTFFLLTLSLLLFSLLIFLFSLPLPYSAFHLSILSEVWVLNFLRPWILHCDTCSSLASLFLFMLDIKTEEAAACPALLNRSDHRIDNDRYFYWVKRCDP